VDPERRTHRDVVDGWVERLATTGLPLPPSSGRYRTPLTFAAPLPVGIECREELADLWLRDPLPLWRVRGAVEQTLPHAVSLTRLDDVWVGEPALAGAIRAADYRIDLREAAPLEALEAACDRFMSAPGIERERQRGSGTVRQDIRPLVEWVLVDRAERALQLRTRFLPDRGTGRPDDVREVLEGWVGAPVAWGSTIRERLLLAD
jgi:radical SAM-linked protein